MKKIMRCAFVVVVLAAISTFAPGQATVRLSPGERSNRNAEYRQAVANYCRLDFDGARLTPEGWTRIKPVTSWRDNPEFHRVAVVTRYQILPQARYEHGRYIFDVQYDISGQYDIAGGYYSDPNRIVVQVELGESNGDELVMDTSDGRPFVGRARLQQWLQTRLTSETDPVTKATIEASLQRFQNETKKPPQSGQ